MLVFILSAIALGKKIFVREPPLHREFMERTECARLHTKLDYDIAAEISARKEEHDKLKVRVDKIADDIARGFERLDQKRSVSVAGLHEELDQSIERLRLEVKGDIKGVHDRINVVLEAVSKLRGKIE